MCSNILSTETAVIENVKSIYTEIALTEWI